MTETTITPFRERESRLLDIVRAHAAGEKDWEAAKQDLVDFDWQSGGDPKQPEYGTPAWAQWYLEIAEGEPLPRPNTWRELLLARDLGMISSVKVREVLDVLVARSDAKK